MSTQQQQQQQGALIKRPGPLTFIRNSIRQVFLGRKGMAKSAKEEAVAKNLCLGCHYVWFEYEDKLLAKWYLNDATGQVEKRKPQHCMIITGAYDTYDKYGTSRRTYYQMKRRPIGMDQEIQHRMAIMKNKSLQTARLRAIQFANADLAETSVESIDDVLRIAHIPHLTQEFHDQGVDLTAAFFLTQTEMEELGLRMGEVILLTRVLEKMRRLPIPGVVASEGDLASPSDGRVTMFIKGERVEHLRVSDNVIRRGIQYGL